MSWNYGELRGITGTGELRGRDGNSPIASATVIASGAKRSTFPENRNVDRFVADAPRDVGSERMPGGFSLKPVRWAFIQPAILSGVHFSARKSNPRSIVGLTI
jgi:hypothetical protein